MDPHDHTAQSHRATRPLPTRRDVVRAGAIAAAGAAGLAGLASGRNHAAAQEASPAATPGSATARPDATPERVAAALPELERLAQQVIDDGGVPGMSIAIVYRDEVVYLGGFGLRDTASDAAVDPDTVFQLASLSKPLAATTVAALVSEGSVGWDDHVTDHLPEFRFSDDWATHEITIRDCFSHRTGLPGGAGDDLEFFGYDRAEVLHRLRYLDLATSPRSHYAYSNMGITLGGEAAATGAGTTWEDAAADLLYAPLGMTSTSSRHDDYVAAANQAALHIPDTEGDGNAWVARFKRDPDPQSPAGGVSSTARDLGEWLRLLLGLGTVGGTEVIAAAALAETHKPHILNGADLVTGGPQFYGLGWNVAQDEEGRTVWAHAGAFSLGARTTVRLLPDESLGIVVLTNAFPTGVPEGIAASFYDLVFTGGMSRDWIAFWNAPFDALYDSFAAAGATYAVPPSAPDPALPPAAYIGAYENDYFGPIEIAAAGDGLELRIGPAPEIRALTHWNRDTFTYVPYPEPPAPSVGVTFLIGPDGVATTVSLEDVAGDPGTFRRVPAS